MIRVDVVFEDKGVVAEEFALIHSVVVVGVEHLKRARRIALGRGRQRIGELLARQPAVVVEVVLRQARELVVQVFVEAHLPVAVVIEEGDGLFRRLGRGGGRKPESARCPQSIRCDERDAHGLLPFRLRQAPLLMSVGPSLAGSGIARERRPRESVEAYFWEPGLTVAAERRASSDAARRSWQRG
jgi:hypothetical protein